MSFWKISTPSLSGTSSFTMESGNICMSYFSRTSFDKSQVESSSYPSDTPLNKRLSISQKFGYIPEAQSDFIFAAYSEEVWFIWDMILIWLYCRLMIYTLIKLKWVNDEYSKVIVIWLLSLIIIQAFINMWVNLKILPNTWLTLPFISYWWTSLMANCISLMLIYKIIENK